jgi:hypothetical protein
MLPRKYVVCIAKAIRNSGLTGQARGRITEAMIEWLVPDNPAFNNKSFRFMCNSDVKDRYDFGYYEKLQDKSVD